jgi:hypothetical protein
VLNIAGEYFTYNESRDVQEADARAIACDWRVVGQDIRKAATELKRKAV